MYNFQTDYLGFIECVLAERGGIFGRGSMFSFAHVLRPLPGKYQEVFRGNTPVGSVSPLHAPSTTSQQGEPVKVRNGDAIYQISASPKIYTMTGTIVTRDRYQRLYEITIEWQVSNVLQFAHMHHLGGNPAEKARSDLKATFQRYASCIEHNKLDTIYFPFEQWIKVLREQYGLTAHCSKPVFRFDDKKAQEDKIHQDTIIKLFALEKETELKNFAEDTKKNQERQQRQFERDEKSKQNEFNREEKLKNHINDARIKLLDQSVNDLVLINRERLRDAADYNGSFKGILEDSLRLLHAFHRLPQEKETIIDETLRADTLPDLNNLGKNTDPTHFNSLPMANEAIYDD